MKKNKIRIICDSVTFLIWRTIAAGLGICLGILLFALLFISRAYLAVSASAKPLKKFNKTCRKEWESLFKNSNAESALKWSVSKLAATDRVMRSSPELRAGFIVVLFFLVLMLFHPPAMWRNWRLYERGTASYYGPGFYMNRTASGDIFSPFGSMTAAHKKLPLGTIVLIKNLDNGKKAIAKINDRGPYVGDRKIDLSEALAKKLGVKNKGLANVEIFITKNIPQ